MNVHPTIGLIAYIFVIIGAINWGLIGILNMNLVARLLGPGSLWTKIAYIVIGISGIIILLNRRTYR